MSCKAPPPASKLFFLWLESSSKRPQVKPAAALLLAVGLLHINFLGAWPRKRARQSKCILLYVWVFVLETTLQLGSGGPSAVTLEETVCDAILPAGQWMAIGGRTDAISIKQIMSESCRERNFSGLAPLSDQHRQAMRALPGLVTRKGRRMKIQIFGWSFGQLQRQTWCVLHSWLDGLATVSARDQRCNQCHEKART